MENNNLYKGTVISKWDKVFYGILLVICCCFSSVITGIFFQPEIITNEISVVTSDTITGSLGEGSGVTDNIYENVAKTVVEINVTLPTGMSAGSGVMFAKDTNADVAQNKYTYIITNHHVIEDGTKIKVLLRDGTEYNAKLVGSDPKTDIGVIKVEALDLPLAVVGSSNLLKVGDVAIAVGNPLGSLGGTVTQGIISALDRDITIDGLSMTLIQTDAAVSPGNSGGGLFTADGKLIGIVNAKSSGTGVEGIGFAIPTIKAMAIAEELLSSATSENFGYVQGRFVIGLTIIQVDASNAALYPNYEFGVYIYNMASAGDAIGKGFAMGDRIVKIDDHTITTVADAKTILDAKTVGDTVKFDLLSDEETPEEKQITLTLTQFIYSLDLQD